MVREAGAYYERCMAGDRGSCWPWPFAVARTTPRMKRNGISYNVHDLAYEEARGPIPDGHCLRHSPNRVPFNECWNPWHMTPFDGRPEDFLSRPQKRALVAELAAGASMADLIERYRIGKSAINAARRKVRRELAAEAERHS